jgi:hypothetical protein
MTSREKIEWVKRMITEEAELNPSGLFSLDLITLFDIEANGGIPDEAPVLISKKEQWSIIQKLEEKGFIKNVSLDKNKKNRVWLEMGDDAGQDNSEEIKERSSYADTIKNVDDLLVNFNLRNYCIWQILPSSTEIQRGNTYTTSVLETDGDGISYKNYECVLLLKEIGLVEEIDFKGFYAQTAYKDVGSRRLAFTLQGDRVLDFIERANGKNAIIRKKALEFIARRMGEISTGNELIDFFRGLGVPEPLIVYPNTKWVMTNNVLLYYASSPKKEDHQKLFKILEEACHPLMHGGDEQLAQKTVDLFNSYLSYDKVHIDFDEEEKIYRCGKFRIPSGDEAQEILMEIEEEEERRYELFRKNKERISLFRKSYQALMGVVEVFCNTFRNVKHEEVVQLNKYYLELCDTLNKIYIELKLYEVLNDYKNYQKPFSNLFAAEKELNGILAWDITRQEMSAVFGEIETLYHKVDGSDVLTEPDMQENLNSIQLYLSTIKKKKDMTKKMVENKSFRELPVQKIEIVRGKLEVSGLKDGLEAIVAKNEDTKIAKGKKVIQLPKFTSTPYKDAAIRFLDERSVLVITPKKNVTVDYEGLGFSDDKSKKPNLAWGFLLGMARNNGETEEIPSPIPDNIKQIKRQISDFFKRIFKNDTEPFYDFSETNTYKIKVKLVPPETNADGGQDDLGVREYLKDTMTSKYEFPKQTDD